MPVVVSHRSAAPPEAVFAVLADGCRYADWVVGAKEIRGADASWPAPGSRFYHRVGVGPLTIDDSSSVEAVDPSRSITLRVRARPAGVGRVRVDLTPTDDGGCRITMSEAAVDGIARATDNPVQRLLLKARNAAALRRLAKLAEEGVRQEP